MPHHYLQIFYRKFKRSKTTYLINLAGLSGGLACGLLIYLWIYGELHVDKFYENADRLYSVMLNDHQPDRVVTGNNGSIVLGKALKNTFPEVEQAVVTTPADWFKSFSISYADKDVVKGTGNFVSKDFFHVFPRNFLSGSANTALPNINSIAISKGLAQKLFNGADDAVGKVLKWKWNSLTRETIVTGVYEDFPGNATIRFDFVLSIDSWEEIIKATEANADLSGGPFNTFIVLTRQADPDKFNNKIANFIKAAIPRSTSTLFVTKYADNYLHGKYVNGTQEGGRIEYVRLFSIIAVCVIIIACINFINLSTAKASERMKEIGIKKTLGATRSTLIRQFLGESIVLCFISLLVAVLLVAIAYPEFESLTGMQFIIVWEPMLIISILIIILLIGFIAGIYPALYLSGFNPMSILRGKLLRPGAGLSIRKALVLFQFSASVIFIVVVMIVYNQIKYVLTINPGYAKDDIIYFEMQGQVANKPDVFISEIKKIPGVVQASAIGSTIVVPSGTPRPGVYWDGKNADDKLRFEQMAVDYDAIEVLDIKMVEGRSFSRKFADTTAILLNETAVQTMALKSPIGHLVNVWGKQKTVIGITKDFHFNSFHEKIMPFIFRLDPGGCLMMMIRVTGGNRVATLDAIKTSYKELNPGNYFDYRFMDDDYQQQYASEKLAATLCKYFAGLTILISCLGLFGLTVFAMEQRIKEISIRIILGASRTSIVHLLSVDFAKVVGISVMIGIPLSYIIMKKWLDDFAYRIALAPSYFIIGALSTLLIAGLTIGVQSFKAYLTKPVESLKN